MGLPSTLTAYSPIPEDSDATPGLWDTRFQALQANVAQVNADAALIPFPSGNTVSFGTYAVSGSTFSFLGGFAPQLSLGTVFAYSGNTIYSTSHWSMGNKRIESIATPVNAQDVANKSYVDVNAGGALKYYVDGAAYNTTSNSSATLSIVTLPAASLVATGDTVRITAWGDELITASGVAQLQFYLNASAIGTHSGAPTTATAWRHETELQRTGATTIRVNTKAYRGAAIVTHSETTVTETLANALPIWLQVWNSSGLNTIAVNAFCLKVEVLKQ